MTDEEDDAKRGPLPTLHRQDAARPCDFARLDDDCVSHLLQLVDVEAVPCFRAVGRAFRAAARASFLPIPPESLVRSGPSVAAWAWEQPTFRAAAGRGSVLACAELGHRELLERVLDHLNDDEAFDRDLWKCAGDAGQSHILQCLLGRAARLSAGDATRLDLKGCAIGDEDMLHLASALRTAPRRRVRSTLKYLDLGSNRLGYGGAIILANALAANATVTSLSLWDNQLTNAAALALADMLKVNGSLKFLSLQCNKIANPGALGLAKALEVNASLTTLYLNNNNRYNKFGNASKSAIRTAWLSKPSRQESGLSF